MGGYAPFSPDNDLPNSNIANKLIGHYWTDIEGKYVFSFGSNQKVMFIQYSETSIGSFGKGMLTATGDYIINENIVTCNFSYVSWNGGDLPEYADLFPGWEYNKSCTKTFSFSEYGENALIVTMPDNLKIKLYSDIDDSDNPENPNENTPDDSEKPDVGFYDFSATKTSLKIQYKIYNKEEAIVTSAKIYYGTSSNPTTAKTASINGVMITANISGLKTGTTYYVKCVAKGKNGVTTTETTKCITSY